MSTSTRSAKNLDLRPIPQRTAAAFIRAHHYSGISLSNSQVHLGVFWEGRLEGAMQFGPSLDKRKLIGLVEGTEWDQFIELNRMAFSEKLPRNSESRAIAVSMRLLRKHAPRLKWVVSYADASQCGDGTIYRASGFVLTDIRPNKSIARFANGASIHEIRLNSRPHKPRPEAGGRSYFDVTGGAYDFAGYVEALGGEVLSGFQLRYVYFLDGSWLDRLTVPALPFSKIEDVGASMYRGHASVV